MWSSCSNCARSCLEDRQMIIPKFRKGCFLAAILLACAPARADCPTADTAGAKPATPPVERAAVAGHRQRLNIYYSVNPDCASRGKVQVRTVSAPQHGKVGLEDTT